MGTQNIKARRFLCVKTSAALALVLTNVKLTA